MTEKVPMQRFKKIKLTQGKCALVDADNYERVSELKWHFYKLKKDKTGYAFSNGKYANGKRLPKVRMHVFIFGENSDHVNGNGLDNRKNNLRKADQFQQAWNKGVNKSKKSFGCKGVSIVKDRNGVPAYWIARITIRKNRIYLGTFKNQVAATRAYIKKAKELHGEFAKWK
jgi:hypothetical protein